MQTQPRCVQLCHRVLCLRTGQLSTVCCLASFYSSRIIIQLVFPAGQLDLADEHQGAFPLGLGPYVQSVLVQATSYAQLLSLGQRLTGVPSAAELELQLSFSRYESINLGKIRTIFCEAGLTKRVRAVKYRCKAVLGSVVFPGAAVPVAADLWPDACYPRTPRFWRSLLRHNLVELQLTIYAPGRQPDFGLHSLNAALRCAERTCRTLRCLQVDNGFWQEPLPMHEVIACLSGLKLPCLTYFGSQGGVKHSFHSGYALPQKESVPALQFFAGTQKPADLFGLRGSGVHVSLLGDLPYDGMAALADSALGPAIRELYISVEDTIGDGLYLYGEFLQATTPLRLAFGFLAMLPSVEHLSITGQDSQQLVIQAGVINALTGLKILALTRIALEGDLTGPNLTQIVCPSLQTRLRSVLARPPPALTSIFVPIMAYEVDFAAVLGIRLPQEGMGHWPPPMPVSACSGGPRSMISRDIYTISHSYNQTDGKVMTKAVRCMD